MSEDLAALELRLRKLHRQHVANQPVDCRTMDAAALAAFEQRYIHTPYQPAPLPNERRQNVLPASVTAMPKPDSSAVSWSAEETRAWEQSHGLRSNWF
jgi:hypothetical protein